MVALCLAPAPTDSDAPLLLRVCLHGVLQARDAAGESLLPAGRKSRALLAVLALEAPAPVSRDRLGGLLWSRSSRQQAQGSMRQSVRELNMALAPTGLLRVSRDHIALGQAGLVLEQGPGALLEDLGGLDPAFDAWLEAARLPAPSAGPATAGPSVLVRPFRSVPGDCACDLACAILADLTAALGHCRSFATVLDGMQPGSGRPALLLDGTVQCAGGRVRVVVRVVDARPDAAGELVWSRRFDGETGDLLELQDRIASETAAQLEMGLLLHEANRIGPVRSEAASAGELLLGAIPALFRLEERGFRAAGPLLEAAARRAPDCAAVHAWSAYWNVLLVGQGWAADPAAAMTRAAARAERAVALDHCNAHALAIAGHARAFLHRAVEPALVLHERALATNPHLPLAWVLAGLALAYSGEHTEAARHIRRATALSPIDPNTAFFESALAWPLLLSGQPAEAAAAAQRAICLVPGLSAGWKVLLAALGLQQSHAAGPVKERLLALEPNFTVRQALARSPLLRPQDRSLYADGLRRAGLPP